MVQASENAGLTGLRLGEGEFPRQLDRVNFGAFLLAVLWAPWHRLWAWFAVFLGLEILETVVGLTMLRFLASGSVRVASMVVFRIVYWTVTLAFALRANHLVWVEERKRTTRTRGASTPQPTALASKYLANQRVWTTIGLIALAVTPLSLLVRSLGSDLADVMTTFGIQVVLLAALFVYDRGRVDRGRRQGAVGE